MAEDNQIQYDITARSQMGEVQQAIKALDQVAGSLDDIRRDTTRMADAANDAAAAQQDMAQSAGSIRNAWAAIAGLGIVGFLGSVAGKVMEVAGAVQEWALGVDHLSNVMAISNEEASALAVSWRQSGLGLDEARSAVESFQGTIFAEIEAQKESQKQLIALEEQRADILADLASAETDHLSRISDLEEERAKINEDGIAQRLAQRDQELAQLSSDHQRALDQYHEVEEQESDRLEEEWKERAERYRRAFEDARTDFADKARRARNFKEFSEAATEFQKKRQQLDEEQAAESSKAQDAADDRIDEARRAAEEEERIFAEKSAAINAKADEDVAKIRERNAQQLAAIDERIVAENASWEKQQADFQERVNDVAAAQAEAASAGGGLTSVLRELGVSLYDAEGQMRPVDDLLWDIKDALEQMPDGAQKAAIISELGFEDLATWLNDGASATESLRLAQELGLVVSDQMVASIREQQAQWETLKLQFLGYAVELADKLNLFELLQWAMERINAATEIGLGLWDQLTTLWANIDALREQYVVIDQLATAWETLVGWFKEAAESGEKLFSILSAEGGASALLGNIGEAIGGGLGLPGFKDGGSITVGGSGGPDSQLVAFRASPNEKITISPPGRGAGGATININAPVYGVEDLKGTIQDALDQYDRSATRTGGS